MSDDTRGDDVPRLMLTVPQFARACQMGTTNCWDQVRAGCIRCVRFGRSVRIPVHEVDARIAGQASGTADAARRGARAEAMTRTIGLGTADSCRACPLRRHSAVASGGNGRH